MPIAPRSRSTDAQPPAWTPARAPARPAVLARVAAVLVLILAACTGTRPDATPVALLVVGQDGPDASLRWLASPLPRDPAAEDEEGYRLLPGFDRTVPGTVRDLTVTRGAEARAWILHRSDAGDGPRDRLSGYDLADLTLDDSASLAAAPDRVIDLGARVADAGVSGFDAPDALCAVRATVAADGAWIGLLHRADACGGSASDVQALLVRTDPGPATTDVVADPSVAYAPFPPVFATVGGRPAAVWARPDGDLWRAFLDGSDPPVATLGTEVTSSPIDLRSGREGLLAGWSNAVAWIALPDASGAPDDDAADPVVRSDLEGGPLLELIDPGTLPGAPLLYRTEEELRVRPSRTATGQEGAARLAGLVAATVGPYDYAHALGPDGVTAYDVLGWLGQDAERREAPSTLPQERLPAGDGHGLAEPVAIGWTFVARDEPPAP